MAAANQVSLKGFRPEETAVNADADSTQVVPNLNDACLLEIFQLLPVKERIKLERVCHHWKVLIPKSFANVKCLEMPHESSLWYQRYGGQSAILKSLVKRIGLHITSADCVYLPEPFGQYDLLLLGSCPKLTKIVWDLNTFRPAGDWNVRFLGRIESLKAVSGSYDDDSYDTPEAFANAIRSLTQLKELDVRGYADFTGAALKNLCRYCRDLKILKIDDRPNNRLSLKGFQRILGLKNLKRLEIVRGCSHPVDDEFIAKLCAGSGAKLEQLRFRSKLVTDASLHLLGIKCGNLAKLDVRECPTFTLAGLNDFVTAISNDPSWTDPTKNRRLHITVGLPSRFQIDVDAINQTTKHPGRLVITNADPVSIDPDWDNWDDRRCCCEFSGLSDEDD